MNLFQKGLYKLNSGKESEFKIECDALSNEDIETISWMIKKIVGDFSFVEGVPRGGLRLEKTLKKYIVPPPQYPVFLIVDDVLTTGNSIEEFRKKRLEEDPELFKGCRTEGVVLFARGYTPFWVDALCVVTKHFWPQFEK